MKKGKIEIIILIPILILFVWLLCKNIFKIDIGTLSDFIIASVALVALYFGRTSLIEWSKTEKEKQKTEKTKQEDIKNIGTERLRDKKADLAAEILEEFHNAKYSIFRIVSPMSYPEEIEKAKTDIEKKVFNVKDEQTIIFYNRYIKEITNINKLLAFSIKSRIYFGEDVQSCFDKIKKIVREISFNIEFLMDNSIQYRNDRKEKYKKTIWNIFESNTIEEIITDVENKLLPYIQ